MLWCNAPAQRHSRLETLTNCTSALNSIIQSQRQSPGDGPEDADSGEAGTGGDNPTEEAEDSHYDPGASHCRVGDQQEGGDHRERRPQH